MNSEGWTHVDGCCCDYSLEDGERYRQTAWDERCKARYERAMGWDDAGGSTQGRELDSKSAGNESPAAREDRRD